MLEKTLTTRFVLGSNLKEDRVGANWAFLLPSLELGRVLYLGAPRATTLVPLAHLAKEILVICRTDDEARRVDRTIAKAGLPNVETRVVGRKTALPLPRDHVDLAVLVDGPGRLRRDPVLSAELCRVIKPGGFLYFEYSRWTHREGVSSHDGRGASLNGSREFWLVSSSGEMRAAVPAHDGATIDYFRRRGLDRPPTGSRLRSAAAGLARGLRRAGLLPECFGALASGDPRAPAGELPRYVCSLAEEAGLRWEGCRWGLAAHGRYPASKILFFIFQPDDRRPRFLVKLTRDKTFDDRLENEFRVITLLEQERILPPDTFPHPLFLGRHAGLVVLGETFVHGRPFRIVDHASSDNSLPRRAIDELIELAVASRRLDASEEAASALRQLLSQYGEVYGPTCEERAFLEGQLQAIQEAGPLPCVLQHSDLNLSNVLLTDCGRIALVDWEAAEPRGVPLWDMLHFLQSYLVLASGALRWADRLWSVAPHFLGESPFRPLLQTAIRDYCVRVGLAPAQVPPLFYTFWVQRAVKHAARLRPDRLQKGHYVRLLRLLIDRRREPALCRLLDASGGCLK